MRKFYKRLKLFYFFADCFLVITLVPVSVYNVANKKWGLVLLILIVFILMNAIAIFILLYYRDIVIEVVFEHDNTIIRTNKLVYTLPSRNFIEIHDSKLSGRTFLLYDDGKLKKTFIFQKRYSPFKSYSLDIDEIKKHMTSAVFKES